MISTLTRGQKRNQCPKKCNCSLHQLSDKDRARRIHEAVEQTCGEVLTNGGVLPIDIFLDDLEAEVVEQIRNYLEEE